VDWEIIRVQYKWWEHVLVKFSELIRSLCSFANSDISHGRLRHTGSGVMDSNNSVNWIQECIKWLLLMIARPSKFLTLSRRANILFACKQNRKTKSYKFFKDDEQIE
jgi:hypothetical protein